jgi:hypothetical protein
LLLWNLRLQHHDRIPVTENFAGCVMVRNLFIPWQTQIHLITEVSTFLII